VKKLRDEVQDEASKNCTNGQGARARKKAGLEEFAVSK